MVCDIWAKKPNYYTVPWCYNYANWDPHSCLSTRSNSNNRLWQSKIINIGKYDTLYNDWNLIGWLLTFLPTTAIIAQLFNIPYHILCRCTFSKYFMYKNLVIMMYFCDSWESMHSTVLTELICMLYSLQISTHSASKISPLA